MADKAQESLTTTSAILAAFIRRNRNQHSHSHWWTTVCTLHNHLRKLVDAPKEPSASFEKRIVERAKWIVEKELPRCYLQVTQLAADNQHAALGLLLLGLLAQINTALSPLLPQSPAEPDVQKSKTAKAGVKIEQAPAATERDRGTAIERTSIPARNKTQVEKAVTTGSTSDVPIKKTKKRTVEATTEELPAIDEKKAKKKKKKKGDAFSDMFGAF